MALRIVMLLALCAFMCPTSGLAQDARIHVDAAQELHRVSPLLTGACIEDVNHEIYGGLYSQMIFGESFQEPAAFNVPGLRALGGAWRADEGALLGGAGDGPKLISESPPFSDGEVSVEVSFADKSPGNAGLIVRVNHAQAGADSFDGYEVSLDPARQLFVLGRHRHDWQLLREVPCEIPLNEWVRLTARLRGHEIEIFVNDQSLVRFEDGASAIDSGTFGLRQWQREARYRNLRVKTAEQAANIPLQPAAAGERTDVSGMWRAVKAGTAAGEWTLLQHDPFLGAQSQTLTFREGDGAIGVENRGVNRWGMNFVAGMPFRGVLWARSEAPVDVWMTLENAAGDQVLAEQSLPLEPGDWRRLEFELTPSASVDNGRFTIQLRRPGAVDLGYVSLRPGAWGEFKNLPVRRDVAEALVNQGIKVLRYGGSMINNPAYRWKNMIGPRDRRPPYQGHWYPYSTNGWGIIDFMDFCEAAGFEYVPTFHMGETPADMADFMEYAKGGPETTWGKLRVRDGHPAPYRLKYLQLGNEERVDVNFAEKFAAIAQVIWAADPEITLVVGDFVYNHAITDPDHVSGAASGILNLDGQRRILQTAAKANREVWFDVHVWTDGPRPDDSFRSMFSFQQALAKIAEDARFKVVVFEFNANSHGQRRALGNALAINAIERNGQIPLAISANGLQPDGQNDNGWDQGLLFLNPTKTWLQPPGYVTQLYSQNYLPRLVQCDVEQSADRLDCNATLSEDRRRLVMQVVNPTDARVESAIQLTGYAPSHAVVQVTELSAPLDAANSATEPTAVSPKTRDWAHSLRDGQAKYTFPPYSVTLMRWQ